MAWYVAPSLQVLRAEINTRWPNRDRTSDGSIGDAAHQAAGTSDHLPNVRGSVNAIDIDEDGVDMRAIIAAIEAHPSTHYWIYEQQIADRDDGFRRRPYSGTNPHTKHLHVSIRQTRTAEQDRRPWGLLEDDMPTADEIADAVVKKLVSADVWPNGYGDAATNKTIALGTFVRNAGRDAETARKGVEQLAGRPGVEVDYDKLADALLRRVLTPGTPPPA